MKLRRSVVRSGLAGVVVVSTFVLGGLAIANDDGTSSPASQGGVFSSDSPLPLSNDELSPSIAPGFAAARRVSDLLTPAGEKPTDGTLVGLERGIVGVTGSPVTGYVLHVASDFDRANVLTNARKGLPASAAAMLQVVGTKVDSAELAAAWKDVADSWASLSKIGSYTVDVDPSTGRIDVYFGDVDAKALNASDILSALPALVDVHTDAAGGFFRASRGNDSAPHWGGAGIYNSNGDGCTSGFTVKRNDTGARASLTAGHCGTPNGNGGTWYSGSYTFGTKNDAYGYPDYDQARLVGQTYDPVIWTNNGEDPMTFRGVSDANDPAIGGSVCMSGYATGTPCAIIVKSLTASACDASGCTTYLGRGKRDDGDIIVHEGDSGAPIYHRWPDGTAGVRGTVVGGDQGGARVYFERWNSIKNHLGVSIVTQ
jgi:hypothetical protein